MPSPEYKFSPYITSNVEYLNRLAKTRSDRRKHSLLLKASPDQILAIVEICANILKNNFVLTNRQRRRLAHYAEYYRSIARARTEKTARNRIQQGGQLAIATLLAPVLSVLAQSLLDKAINN
jgi:hypothetical protein